MKKIQADKDAMTAIHALREFQYGRGRRLLFFLG
jgi:hypothetical protein